MQGHCHIYRVQVAFLKQRHDRDLQLDSVSSPGRGNGYVVALAWRVWGPAVCQSSVTSRKSGRNESWMCGAGFYRTCGVHTIWTVQTLSLLHLPLLWVTPRINLLLSNKEHFWLNSSFSSNSRCSQSIPWLASNTIPGLPVSRSISSLLQSATLNLDNDITSNTIHHTLFTIQYIHHKPNPSGRSVWYLREPQPLPCHFDSLLCPFTVSSWSTQVRWQP